MNRASGGGGMMNQDPIPAVLGRPRQAPRGLADPRTGVHRSQCLIEANRDKVEAIADELVARREVHGNEVVELLHRHSRTRPEMDRVRRPAR
jgi:hypothetical protein